MSDSSADAPAKAGPGTTREQPTLALALLAITTIGLTLRLVYLERPMHLDEAYTYNEYASRGLWTGIMQYTLPNNHLLNTALVWFSTTVLGIERWAVRLPALLAGVAMIPLAWLVAARFCGRRAALVAAALAATSEPLVAYSTNARGYTMVGLATLLLVLVAEAIVRTGGTVRQWIELSIVAARARSQFRSCCIPRPAY